MSRGTKCWSSSRPTLRTTSTSSATPRGSSCRCRSSSGFGARYILRRGRRRRCRRGSAWPRSRSVELEKIYFVDAEPNLGEPLAEALQPGSEFRSRLASHKPQQTTVTIWVYPDSFDQFRALKAELFKLGYLTAGRPLPDGHPIGGSPDGSRSSAE